MDYSWITTTLSASLMVLLSTAGIYVTLIVCTRAAGVRSFSKLSSFDFAITVAIGSLISSTVIAENPSFLLASVALISLFLLQISVAKFRRSSSLVRFLVDNKPVLLMKADQMLEENMRQAKVTKSDIFSKLREANVLSTNQIRAVIMETTGDISVLHHDDENIPLDTEILHDLEAEYNRIS